MHTSLALAFITTYFGRSLPSISTSSSGRCVMHPICVGSTPWLQTPWWVSPSRLRLPNARSAKMIIHSWQTVCRGSLRDRCLRKRCRGSLSSTCSKLGSTRWWGVGYKVHSGANAWGRYGLGTRRLVLKFISGIMEWSACCILDPWVSLSGYQIGLDHQKWKILPRDLGLRFPVGRRRT